MDLIEYVAPINDKKNRHKGGYEIGVFCVRFHNNFIHRNESAHNISDDSTFMKTS